VLLVEISPFLSNEGRESLEPHKINARLLEVIRHPNITVWTNTHIQSLNSESGYFQVELNQHPRYVDLTRCTACGECIETCPVSVLDQDIKSKSYRKAIFLSGQPGCAAIEKPGRAPCASTCPGGIHVQGYVALIAQGRFQEAIELIRDAIPFPSVCGRVCNHYCETECSRGKVDEAVNIMALKRFVADWAYKHRSDLEPGKGKKHTTKVEPTGKKIAIIGAGPAGLTAARGLVRLGHDVIVFDALPSAGGMMRVGIPPHRLPDELLEWEIQQILDEGVKLRLNTWIDDIPGLLESGYDAVLIATGAHKAKKIPLKNSNHPDNLLSLDVLRRACLGEETNLTGKRVIVLGGGNVALDTVRTVIRLGASEVRMVSLEPRGEMPGFNWEIEVAEEEGVEMFPGRAFNEIVLKDENIIGVDCVEVNFHGFEDGRPIFEEIPDTQHILPADVVIWAIGQEPNFTFLPTDNSINTRFPTGIETDENMMTTMPGVFVAGDVHRGMTFFVIDAIGEGNKVARNIDRYLQCGMGIQEPARLSKIEFTKEESKKRFAQGDASQKHRAQISSIPLETRVHNFREVDLTLTETEALNEAKRCLVCGVCSECMACESICKTGAINHNDDIKTTLLSFKTVILADNIDHLEVSLLLENQNFYSILPNDALAGSAAAADAMHDLFANRQPLPVSSGSIVKGLTNRIGVFICQCGDAISQIIDTKRVCDYISGLPDVIYVQVLAFSCSPETTHLINKAIESHDLDGVVIAACSCCNIDQVCYSCTYQRVRCKDNLGVFSPSSKDWRSSYSGTSSARFEFVNIREQCAYVHTDDHELATTKANTMIGATVARVKAAPAVLASARPIDKSTIILGGGSATSFCQDTLNRLGIIVHQIEGKPDNVQRSSGFFIVTKENQSWQASAIVLIPRDEEIRKELLLAFGRERRRPQIHADWGGLDTHRPGVYYIDPEQDPSIAGPAAAARVIAWISRRESHPPIAAIVDPDRCRACKTCIDTCEYCAPELVEINGRYSSWIDPAICTGCGTCAAHCPSGAISAGCSTDAQLEAMLDSILK
jgi:NADPH-dependent glutamate synthase beta subunit-like oxidoreductase/NAD-dependent dihydropyrimidine dehydrogenase PreA subunit